MHAYAYAYYCMSSAYSHRLILTGWCIFSERYVAFIKPGKTGAYKQLKETNYISVKLLRRQIFQPNNLHRHCWLSGFLMTQEALESSPYSFALQCHTICSTATHYLHCQILIHRLDTICNKLTVIYHPPHTY